jgi:DNA repair protein RecO (recombination protein O)
MKTVTTCAIVLSRTDYGEADRIIKFLTPDNGKVSVIAKGVRKSKSKLAGSIELFSVSDVTYILGRSDIYTLISARLSNHYDNIGKDLERTNTGYELIKLINSVTADSPEPSYFNLLHNAFKALDDINTDYRLTTLWFNMQILKLAGYSPNLMTDSKGTKLEESKSYSFDLDTMNFIENNNSPITYTQDHIKFLRLGFNAASPLLLGRVGGNKKLTADVSPLVFAMLQANLLVKN